MPGIEKSLRLELVLELFEGHLEGPQSPGFHPFDDELILSTGGIGGQAGPAGDLHTVFQDEGRL